MTYRARNLGIATMLAALAAVLVTVYVTNVRRNVQSSESGITVLVASRDIPAGTPGAEIVAGHLLGSAVVPRRAVAPGAVSSPAQIQQLVATQPLYAGDQVTSRRFGAAAVQGVQGQLKGTLRALQVPGDGNQLLAGTLADGDRVDVVAAVKFTGADGQGSSIGTERIGSRIVLRNIRVIQAPAGASGVAKLGAGPAGSLSAILAVTDSQAQKLFFVIRNGDWSLALRPSVEPADSPDSVETAQSVLGDGLSALHRSSVVPVGGPR